MYKRQALHLSCIGIKGSPPGQIQGERGAWQAVQIGEQRAVPCKRSKDHRDLYYGAACRANHKRVEERAEIADQPGSRRCCPLTMRLGRVVVAAALVGTCSGYQDGALKRIDVGYVMSWYGYRDRAASEGGRLPTTAELAEAGIDVGDDQWIAITPSPGDQETGRRDAYLGNGEENAWANIGPRKYQIEYPDWGLDDRAYHHKGLTYFYIWVPSCAVGPEAAAGPGHLLCLERPAWIPQLPEPPTVCDNSKCSRQLSLPCAPPYAYTFDRRCTPLEANDPYMDCLLYTSPSPRD